MGADGLLALIELPIRELELVVGCFFEIEADGILLLIELPMRDMLLELMRLLEVVIVCLPLLALAGVDFAALEEGLRTLREVLDREVVTRLDAALPDRDGAGVLVVSVFWVEAEREEVGFGALELLRAETFGALDLV